MSTPNFYQQLYRRLRMPQEDDYYFHPALAAELLRRQSWPVQPEAPARGLPVLPAGPNLQLAVTLSDEEIPYGGMAAVAIHAAEPGFEYQLVDAAGRELSGKIPASGMDLTLQSEVLYEDTDLGVSVFHPQLPSGTLAWSAGVKVRPNPVIAVQPETASVLAGRAASWEIAAPQLTNNIVYYLVDSAGLPEEIRNNPNPGADEVFQAAGANLEPFTANGGKREVSRTINADAEFWALAASARGSRVLLQQADGSLRRLGVSLSTTIQPAHLSFSKTEKLNIPSAAVPNAGKQMTVGFRLKVSGGTSSGSEAGEFIFAKDGTEKIAIEFKRGAANYEVMMAYKWKMADGREQEISLPTPVPSKSSGDWNHYAFTLYLGASGAGSNKRNKMRVYLNGQEAASTPDSAFDTIKRAGNLAFSNNYYRHYGGINFQVDIKDLFIWSLELPPERIGDIFLNGIDESVSGLRTYWPMDNIDANRQDGQGRIIIPDPRNNGRDGLLEGY